MSCNLEKDARLALCVEVEVQGDDVRVLRMVATGDFGAALNPDALQNQMTGAIIQGLGGALWEQVAFDGTTQLTRRLSHYRVPRFRDVPADRRAADRSAGHRAGWRRRITNHAHGPGHRRGDLRGDRPAAPHTPAGAPWPAPGSRARRRIRCHRRAWTSSFRSGWSAPAAMVSRLA